MEKFELDKPDNLVEMFEESIAKHVNNLWMGTKRGGSYDWVTYKEVARRVDNLRAGLSALGVGKGDVVSIIADNSVEWAVCCYAAYGRVAPFVPMYEAELTKVWKYIITDSGAKVLFVSSDSVFDRVQGFIDEIETLEHVIKIEGRGEGTMAALEALGKASPVESAVPSADDIAGLIYTSGTTGDPKGVLLSHGNLTSNVHAILKSYDKLDDSIRTLSFLPWAHSYGQVAELHLMMRLGGSTGFAESPQTIVDDLLLVKPSMLVAVPRIFNRVYDGLHKKMKDQGGLAESLFNMGMEAAAKAAESAENGEPVGAATQAKLFVADKIVFHKIRAKFGGKLRMAVSSSAALNPDIGLFFQYIGIPLYDCWGMTELSPAGTLNTPDAFKNGSAGKALDKVRLEIDRSDFEEGSRDGELIVYGPNVMQGYHNKPEATAATLTEDGGMRTGDQAYIDDDGFLFITGRIKEQFKLENGKFVSPAALEEEVKMLPEVEHAMIFGLNKPHTVCLVVPDFAVLEGMAKEKGWPADHEKMVEDESVKKMFEEKITTHLKGNFGGYEIPRSFLILSEPFTTENGILTPTLKLKRRKVIERYGELVEVLYNR